MRGFFLLKISGVLKPEKESEAVAVRIAALAGSAGNGLRQAAAVGRIAAGGFACGALGAAAAVCAVGALGTSTAADII